MTNKLLSILCLILAGCGSMAVEVPLATATMPLNASKTSQISTETPTPTVGYQNTAEAALTAQIESGLTAQAAQVIVAQITAEQDARNFEQCAWTVTADAMALQYDGMTQQASGYTATAYQTSVPATQTQQARVNALQGTAMVMTITAPTQIVAMARSETYAKYADRMQQVELLMQVAFAVLLLAMAAGVVFLIATRPHVDVPELTPATVDDADLQPIFQAAENNTVLTIRTDNGGGYAHTERTVVPCTPEQFGKLVTGVLGGMSLAFNQWEGADSPFSRDQFTAVRNWLLSNRLAQSVGQGALILSAVGESLFIEWQNNQALSDGYKFQFGGPS